jgi:GTP-binding protein Era
MSSQTDGTTRTTRAGFVALVGRPNAGKSTLLNRLVDSPLSIVTPRPQTTWRRVSGIRTEGHVQMIFLDAPGVMVPRDRLQRSLVLEAEKCLREADVAVVLCDPSEASSVAEREALLQSLREKPVPVIGAISKVDVARPDHVAREADWIRRALSVEPRLLSGTTGEGVEELLAELARRLPEGPFLYPVDDVSFDPVRFFVTEMIRETVFELFHDEIPYAIFCEVEEFREGASPIYIQVNIFVERSTQKGILIGKGGAAIRELGSRARAKIEHFLGEAVYLDLWIKVLPGWRKKEVHLRRLGLPLPERHAD